MHLAERVTCSIADAGEATGFSRTKLNDLITACELETVKIGRRRLVVVQSLLRLLGLEGQAKRPRHGAIVQADIGAKL